MSDQLNDRRVLLEDMIDFNNKYNTYVRCSNPSTNANCSATDKSIDTVSSVFAKLAQYSDDPAISNASYDVSLNYIKTTYNSNIIQLRNELDEKMKELNFSDNSILSEEKTRFDITIYTGVLWTILATSVIYYVFTRL